MKKFVLLLATMLLLLLPVVGMAADLEIEQVTYTGVDKTLNPDDTFTISVKFKESLQNVQDFGLSFTGNNIVYYSPMVYFSDGKIDFNCTIPKNVKPGSFDLKSLSVGANDQYYHFEPGTEIFPALTLTCKNDICTDFDGPVVTNVTFEQNGQVVYPGSTLTVQMKIKDASKIAHTFVEFAPDSDAFDYYFSLQDFSFNAVTQTYTITGEVPEYAKLGKNYLMIAGAADEWENNGFSDEDIDRFYVIVEEPDYPISTPAAETPVVTSIDKVTTVTKPTAVVPETGIPGLKLVVGNYDLKEVVNTTGGTVANIAAYDLHLEDELGDKITHIGEKIVVYLPYPAGYNMNSNVTWTLKHYKNDFSSYTLMPLFPTEKGLRFETNSFSPYVLTWTTKTAAVPSTGDNTPIALLTLLALVSLSAMVLIVRRKEA